MPTYDYNCPQCGKRMDDVHCGYEDTITCICGETMTREFPCPNVKIPVHMQAAPNRAEPRPLADNGVRFGPLN